MTDLKGKDADYWANFLLSYPPRKRNAIDFVNGNDNCLIMSLVFVDTPQGQDYWYEIHNNRKNSPNYEEGKSFVKWMLRGNIEDTGEDDD